MGAVYDGREMKPAFSTVACPDWTLARLEQRLEDFGYLGCELRTFGNGTTSIACDPALTKPSKTLAAFRARGVDVCSLATGIRFDEVVSPPVIGNVISDTEKSVRECKGMIDLALRLECPLVRVFAFELPEGERRVSGIARIAQRLAKAADYCRNSGVKLMLENGGSFCTARELVEILDKVGSPMLTAAYSPAVARQAGEDPAQGARILGERLACVKLKDLRGDAPVALGDGQLECRKALQDMASAGFAGWVVYEFDRAWLPVERSVDVDAVLVRSARTLFGWVGELTGRVGATSLRGTGGAGKVARA